MSLKTTFFALRNQIKGEFNFQNAQKNAPFDKKTNTIFGNFSRPKIHLVIITSLLKIRLVSKEELRGLSIHNVTTL